MKQKGSFDTLVSSFRQLLAGLPDKRTGKNTRYGMEDAALSAVSVFFTQTPSLLAFQRTMEKSKGRSNAQTLFGVHKIPCDNHIRDLLDPLKPALVNPVFEQALEMLESGGQLNSLRGLDDNRLIAMDGTEYFSSSQIHSPQCATRKLKSGEIMRYFHSVVTPVIVSPERSVVIPLVPEFVVPQDGHDRQDGENRAAKRWLLQHGEKYSRLKVTVLGDDLDCHQPLCQLLREQQFNFILTCLPASHTTLYEHLQGLNLPTPDGKLKMSTTILSKLRATISNTILDMANIILPRF